MQLLFNFVIVLVYYYVYLVLGAEFWSTQTPNPAQEDPPWIWGIVDVTSANNIPTDTIPTETPIYDVVTDATTSSHLISSKYTEDNNPCLRNISSVPPDFRKMGLGKSRISEIKCAEHIWHMKYREVKEKNDDDYFEKRKSSSHFSRMTFNAGGVRENPYLDTRFKYNIYAATFTSGQPIMTKSGTKYRKEKGDVFIEAIGGRDTEPGEFPHMAAIGWKAANGTWTFKCGGTLISNKFVLTAGHCTRLAEREPNDVEPVPKIVRLGDKNIADVWSNGLDPIDVNILKIHVHPLYRSPKTYYDIALIELEKEVEFTYYLQPACLWNKFDVKPLGNEAIVTGWGVINAATLETSPELKAVTLDIIDTEQCDKLLTLCTRKWCGMQDNQICAGKLSGGMDSCQGDSGGPLQVKISLPITTQGTISYVIGVTSFGRGCAIANTPGVYARVSEFVEWIEGIVWP